MELASEKAITINTSKNSKNFSKTDQGIKNVIFGSIAGMSGKLVEYPFDTVKTRLQSQPSDHKLFKGPLDCFRQTLAHEGFFGLYRGMSPPMVGAILENASLFLVYNHIQTMIGEFTTQNYNNLQHKSPPTMTIICLAGALSGTSASFFLTPIELIKCKLQVQETFTYGSGENIVGNNLGGSINSRYSGPLDVIKRTLKIHGIGGFYRGHSGTVVRETAGTAAWFGTYEFISRLFVSNRISLKEDKSSLKKSHNITKDDLSAAELMSAGACAGMTYNLLMFPVDSIKSRMQTDEEVMIATRKKVIKRGFWQISRELYKSDGISGFYRGCGITVARAAPSSAIIFMTYELLARHFS
ncbi:mitochondrial carrier domain-containing protein [Glomus cerebriforme]|uniref:Mitochondrial carrier domain-containing protein n=1 Tax=Glomus cerebriforme TaxID=658196 RepID=A0A397TGS3_9GLOM|nr:mitochondrial carrier domain-containing protein [Glomus cerebriforme]